MANIHELRRTIPAGTYVRLSWKDLDHTYGIISYRNGCVVVFNDYDKFDEVVPGDCLSEYEVAPVQAQFS